jgi:small-conductance mechanosensitive channel
MAFAFDKPLRDFLQNFQKDLNVLQKKLKQESDELLHKAKAAANSESLNARRQEIEKLLEQKLTKIEPSINKFVHELNTTAKKAGVNLGDFEKNVRVKLASARGKLAKDARRKKTPAKRAPAKKVAVKKAATKRSAQPKAKVDTTAATTEATTQL